MAGTPGEESMPYELVIGTKNWSSWSLRAWLAVKATGVPFTETMIPLRRPDSSPTIRKLSPSARVPLLLIREAGSQTTVFDSLAICETIAERHPETRLWPDDPDTRAMARSYAAEMHSGFLALRETLHMDFARVLPCPDLTEEVQGQIDRIRSAWQEALQASAGGDDQGGFLFGRFSIADCFYAPVVSRFLTYGIPMDGRVRAYAERMMALPAMQEWHTGATQEIAEGLPDQWKLEMVRNAR